MLGASFDPPARNKAFREKLDFPFPLLCDTGRELGLAFGACDRADAQHARRITVVIDADGRVARIYDKVDPSTHAEQILADLGETGERA